MSTVVFVASPTVVNASFSASLFALISANEAVSGNWLNASCASFTAVLFLATALTASELTAVDIASLTALSNSDFAVFTALTALAISSVVAVLSAKTVFKSA